MSSLAEWLLDRIAEDEAAARAMVTHLGATPESERMAGEWLSEVTADVAGWVRLRDPARVLADCAAKRRIVEEHREWNGLDDPRLWICGTCHDYSRHDAERWPCDTLRALASVYADQPGWREEWAING